MKKHHLSLIASVFLLTGCAGMNSEFTCGATAKDQCMTMDEANNKARAHSESAVKTAVLPPLATLAPVSSPAPVPRAASSVTTVSRITPVASPSPSLVTPIVPAITTAPSTVAASSSRNPLTGRSRATASLTGSTPVSATRTAPVVPWVRATPASGWSDIGMAPPIRQSASVARLWIAAWVDEGQVYHQPSVVSFEATAAHWSVQGGTR